MAPVTPVLLWQLPPQLHRDVVRLDRFASLLPGWVRHAVEFRHPSWVDEAVDEVLATHRIARVWTSSAVAPQPPRRTTDLVYLRFHGLGPDPFRWDYRDEELRPWVEAVLSAVEGGARCFVYFNNDFGGHAVRNALRFRELAAGAR